MEGDSFFDTNVIVFYGKYKGGNNSKIIQKCHNYVSNKKGKFVICFFLEQEIERVIKKNKIIHKEIIQKIRDLSHEIGSSACSHLLKGKDIAYAKKIYEISKDKPLEIVSNSFLEDETYLEGNIEYFLKTQIDEIVIPLEQINTDLVSKIHDIIPNHADCKILASAIQLQDTRAIFLFVTADGKDLDPNGYEYFKEHFEINHPKEKYKFPELHNLMFVD